MMRNISKFFCIISLAVYSPAFGGELTHKNYKGQDVPTEWTDRVPASKETSLKVSKGDSFDKAIEILGIPFQDSGKGRHIWHYRLDDGSYLQLIGGDRIEKVMRYSDKDIIMY